MSDSQSPASGASPPPNASHAAPKIRRRNRIITSCLECRRRKLKCDRSHPCNHCIRAKRDCIFLAPSLDANSKNKLNQFKESVDSLEKNLGKHDEEGLFGEWNVSSQSRPDLGTSRKMGSAGAERLREPVPADEQGLEPSPLALADIIYEDEEDDVINDLGIRLGKARISERIGGFIRPRFSEELTDTLRMNPNLQMPAVVSRAEEDAARMPPPAWTDEQIAYLQPSGEYMAPGLGLSLSLPTSEDLSLLTFLPSQDFADKLLARYWSSVHTIARVLHRSSFEKQYASFWKDISQGFEPPTSLQALIFATQFSASVSLTAEEAQKTFGCPREKMVETFRTGCEYALSKSNLMRTTRTTTLQAFVMYLIPLCRSEVSRAHAGLVSMAIRLAECAGFHRDGTNFGLSPVETHVRRLVWYELCFLDIRVCEAVGPRPTIRAGEFDTKMPLCVDDGLLESYVVPAQDLARFTEMTIPRIKYATIELNREIWIGRPLVEKGERSLTDLLRKVEEFRETNFQKFMPLLDESIPIQAFASRLLHFAITRARISILHRYVVSTPSQTPERLLRLVWVAGARSLDIAVEWDSSPDYAHLAWYLGAYNQWHVALLFVPLIVMAKKPQPELDRVWRALDYVFEFPANLSREEKIRLALWVARSRLEELQRARKHRLPTSLEQRLGVGAASSKSYNTPDTGPRRSPVPQSAMNVADAIPSKLRNDPNELLRTISNDSNAFDNSGAEFPAAKEDFNFANYTQQSYPIPGNLADSSMFEMPLPLTSPQPRPFDSVDWDDFDRIFAGDNGAMFDQHMHGQESLNDMSQIPDLGLPQTTFLPMPTWGHRKSSHGSSEGQGHEQSPSQNQY